MFHEHKCSKKKYFLCAHLFLLANYELVAIRSLGKGLILHVNGISMVFYHTLTNCVTSTEESNLRKCWWYNQWFIYLWPKVNRWLPGKNVVIIGKCEVSETILKRVKFNNRDFIYGGEKIAIETYITHQIYFGEHNQSQWKWSARWRNIFLTPQEESYA